MTCKLSSVQAPGAGCPCSRDFGHGELIPCRSVWLSQQFSELQQSCGRGFVFSWTKPTLHVLLWAVRTRKAVLELLMNPAWLHCSEVVPHRGSPHISASSRLSKAPVTSPGAAGGPCREDLQQLYCCVMMVFDSHPAPEG